MEHGPAKREEPIDVPLLDVGLVGARRVGEQVGQGRENVKKFLIENPDLVMEIQDRVLKEVGLVESDEVEAREEEEVDLTDAKPAKASKGGKATSPDDEPITLK